MEKVKFSVKQRRKRNRGRKMKEIVIILVVIALVCTANFMVQQYLTQTSDEMLGQLAILKEELKQAQNSGDNEKAKSISEEVLANWEIIDKNWSMIIIHEELDMIELSLLQVNAAVEVGSFEDGLQEIDKSIFLVGHIKEKESFKIKNIF